MPSQGIDPNAVREQCVDCGVVFWRDKGRRKLRCWDCRYARIVVAAKQSKAREGDTYVATVRGQCRYWMAEAKRLGLPIEGGGAP